MSNLQSTHNQAENQALSWCPGFGRSEYAGAVVAYLFHVGKQELRDHVRLSNVQLHEQFGCGETEGRRLMDRLKADGVIERTRRYHVRLTLEGLSRVKKARLQWYDKVDHYMPFSLTPRQAAALAVAGKAHNLTGAAKIMGMTRKPLYMLIRKAYRFGCPEPGCGYGVKPEQRLCPSCGGRNFTFDARAWKKAKMHQNDTSKCTRTTHHDCLGTIKDNNVAHAGRKTTIKGVKDQAAAFKDTAQACVRDPANLRIALKMHQNDTSSL